MAFVLISSYEIVAICIQTPNLIGLFLIHYLLCRPKYLIGASSWNFYGWKCKINLSSSNLFEDEALHIYLMDSHIVFKAERFNYFIKPVLIIHSNMGVTSEFLKNACLEGAGMKLGIGISTNQLNFSINVDIIIICSNNNSQTS